MKKKFNTIHVILFILCLSLVINVYKSNAQSVAINATGASADPSAILDVSSTTKGLLAPRMTFAQRSLISAPSAGLLVYQTDALAGFYYNNGNSWLPLSNVGYWGLNGTSIYNTNTDHKVGIGTTTPMARLHVADSSVVFSASATLPTIPGLPPISGAGNRMMWYADKAAFRVGGLNGNANNSNSWDKDSIGNYSFAGGLNNLAKGNYSMSFGLNNYVSGNVAFALGLGNSVSGPLSGAFGDENTVSGNSSNAFGSINNITNDFSFITGYGNTVSGYRSFASGEYNNVSGLASFAVGSSNWVSNSSYALGNRNFIYGGTSAAIGGRNKVYGYSSVAMGESNIAKKYYSVVVGSYNDTTETIPNYYEINQTDRIFQIGNGLNNAGNEIRSNALTVLRNANTGIGNILNPTEKLEIDGAIRIADAFSSLTAADGTIRHTASGFEGRHGGAWIPFSGTVSGSSYWGLNGTSIYNTNTDHKVGIGTNNPMARLHVADSSVVFSASAVLPTIPGLPPISGAGNRMMWYADKAAFRVGGIATAAANVWDKDSIGNYSVGVGYNTKAKGEYSFAAGNASVATGDYAVAMGNGVTASGWVSTAFGYKTQATNNGTLAMGFNSIASGQGAFAGGSDAVASNDKTFAYGSSVTASGAGSFALGLGTTSSGNYATAMGVGSSAIGQSSFSMGVGTKSKAINSFVIGEYNDAGDVPSSVTPAVGDRLFQVGNGTSGSTHNAITVLRSGFVGIGYTSQTLPADLLEVNGKIGCVSVNTLSDRRYKSNIKTIDSGLIKILQLRGVTYDWDKTRTERNLDNKNHIGFIAQELELVLPQAVNVGEDAQKTRTVDYQEVIPVLVEAIKDQQKEIETLKKTLNEKDAAFAQRIAALEAIVLNKVNQTDKK